MAAPAKPRKRIVPEQIISPSKSQAENESLATAVGPKVDLGDLKEHSALAAELLGPGRKIHVNLAQFQTEKKEVDWKELLKERGVKREKRVVGPQTGGDAPGGLLAPPRPAATNPLALVMQKLERAVGMGNYDEEDSDSDSLRYADADGGSDMEDDAEGGDDGGGEEGGGSGAPSAAPAPGAGEDAAAGPSGAGTTARRREKGNDYDYCDDWIDDTEFIDMLEYSDRRKLKYDGFFIARGQIDRVDELIPGAVPDKAPRKRKVEGEGAAAGSVGGGGGDEPAKKRRKEGGVEGSAPVARKSAAPYVIPADAVSAIGELRALAAAAPAPAAPEPGADPRAHRKSLPPAVLEHLKSVEHIFQREVATHKAAASKRLMDEILSFLEPFTSKENLRLYVCGRPAPRAKAAKEGGGEGGADGDGALLSPAELRALLERTVPPPAAPEEFTGSEADAGNAPGGPAAGPAAGAASAIESGKRWKAVPMATRRAVYEYMKARMGEAQLKSLLGQSAAAEALALFPPGTMDLASVKHIYSSQRQKEMKSAGEPAAAPAPAAAAAPAPAPASTPAAPGPAATTPALQGLGMSLAAMAAAAGNAAAAAGPKAPAAPAAPAAPPQQAQQASTPASAGTWTTGNTTDGAAGTGMSDDEIVAVGVGFGADEATLRSVLSSASTGKYQRVFVRMLALAGPEGSSVREMAVKAVQVGLEDWNGESSNVKNGLSRHFNLDCVAALGGAKYALKCFPGVVDIRGPGRGGKKAGESGGGSAPSSAAPSGAVPDVEEDVVIVDS